MLVFIDGELINLVKYEPARGTLLERELSNGSWGPYWLGGEVVPVESHLGRRIQSATVAHSVALPGRWRQVQEACRSLYTLVRDVRRVVVRRLRR